MEEQSHKSIALIAVATPDLIMDLTLSEGMTQLMVVNVHSHSCCYKCSNWHGSSFRMTATTKDSMLHHVIFLFLTDTNLSLALFLPCCCSCLLTLSTHNVLQYSFVPQQYRIQYSEYPLLGVEPYWRTGVQVIQYGVVVYNGIELCILVL